MSEELLLQLFGVLGGAITAIVTIWKGSSIIISNLEKRNQKLTDELITAKTQALKETVDNLTTKLNKATEDLEELKLRADQLRLDLDAEKEARLAESKRAARAEYLEAQARRELEKKQIEADVLRSVLQVLSVSVPEDAIRINIVRSSEHQLTTEELTEAANQVAAQLGMKQSE